MEKMERINIDDFFKEKIIETHTEFDEQAWDSLETLLDKKKRKDKVFVWWWHWEKIAAVFLLGLLGYAVYDFNYKPKSEKNQVAFKKQIAPEKTFAFKESLPESIEKNQKKQPIVNYKNDTYTPKKNPQIIVIQFENSNHEETINLDRNLQERFLENRKEIKVANLAISDSSLLANETANEPEKQNISHTIGFAFSPAISPNGLQAGLGYTHEFGISERTSIVSGLAYTPWTSSNNNNAFVDNTASMVDVGNNIRLQTIEIPLEAKIKITEKLSFSSGISNTFLLQEKIGDAINNDFEWSISSLNVGLQYDLRIGKNSHLNLQPYYRFPLQSIGSVGTQISGFGLRAGYSYGKGKKQHRNTMEN